LDLRVRRQADLEMEGEFLLGVHPLCAQGACLAREGDLDGSVEALRLHRSSSWLLLLLLQRQRPDGNVGILGDLHKLALIGGGCTLLAAWVGRAGLRARQLDGCALETLHQLAGNPLPLASHLGQVEPGVNLVLMGQIVDQLDEQLERKGRKWIRLVLVVARYL